MHSFISFRPVSLICSPQCFRRYCDVKTACESKSLTKRVLSGIDSPICKLPSTKKTRFICEVPREVHGRQNPKATESQTVEVKTSLEAMTGSKKKALPDTYRRLIAESTGSCFREVATIAESNLPDPGDGEVLVKVDFAGINGGCETFRARGEYAFSANKEKRNFGLGAEAVGSIVAIGQNSGSLKAGQAVAVTGAGYSEYAVAKAAMCFPLREASAEAVAVSLSGLTSAGALLYKAGISPGMTVLVTAAAGGTGHFAVQIAKLKGCHTIATCGSPDKAQKLRALGADRVINYKDEDVGEVLAREYPQKIDVAYEGVGGQLRDAVLANLSPSGKVLAVGYISEYPHTHQSVKQQSGSLAGSSKGHSWDLPPADELMWQAQTLHNGDQTIYGQVWPKDPQQIKAAKEWIFEQYYQGKLQAWVDPREFKGLESITDATDYMLSGQSIGKVVVDLR